MPFTYELFDEVLDQMNSYMDRFSLDRVEFSVTAYGRQFFVSGFLCFGRNGIAFSHYSPDAAQKPKVSGVCEPVAALSFEAIDLVEFGPLRIAKDAKPKQIGFQPPSKAERLKYKEDAQNSPTGQ